MNQLYAGGEMWKIHPNLSKYSIYLIVFVFILLLFVYYFCKKKSQLKKAS